jgi:topoisomerase-4 subunit A
VKPETGIIEQSLHSLLGEKYLAYALSTITARSLPDVRDGLKPVHRRLLFAMRQLQLAPNTMPKKSARVVGDVIGKFHPHGDTAVYEAMVRLAQEFAARYPLVKGEGNFGSIDGDSAAAMRYTEAKLTEVAMAMLDGIDEDTVDFRDTYDGEGSEPIVLPGSFPNLLANGATGIAVGMATSIPPHNVGEICDALLLLIDNPDVTIARLVKKMPGPDFPTGGIIVEPKDSIAQSYATGRGGFTLRARWKKEMLGQGMWQIAITEIPYQVQKAKLFEKMAELVEDKKIALIDKVADESAEDVRIVITPRSRTVDEKIMMEALFKATDLEVRIPFNMNVLDGGRVPRLMNLKEVLQAFLDHRLVVLGRRSRFRLAAIDERLERLEGFLIAYLDLDLVIKIIRESDEPKPILMKKLKLSDPQAEAILNMRLRSLRKLEEMELKREHASLTKERKELNALLKDKGRQWQRIGEEIGALKDKFGGKTALGKRRSDFAEIEKIDMPLEEALIEREPLTIICSERGWIRAVRGHGLSTDELKYKEGDGARFVIEAETVDRLLVFGSNGRIYTIACDKISRGRGFGEPLRLMIDLPDEGEIVAMYVYRPGKKLLLASSDGRGFVVPTDEVLAQTRAGRQVLNLDGKVTGQFCVAAEGNLVAVSGTNRKLVIFPLSEIPEMNRGRGVALAKKDVQIADIKVFAKADGLSWKSGERTRKVDDIRPWMGKRAQAGRMVPEGFPRNNRFST